MTIQVTLNDIAVGTPYSATRCPIARALARCGYAASVNVTEKTIRYVDRRGQFHVLTTPAKVALFAANFDAGHTVDPFEFGLHE